MVRSTASCGGFPPNTTGRGLFGLLLETINTQSFSFGERDYLTCGRRQKVSPHRHPCPVKLTKRRAFLPGTLGWIPSPRIHSMEGYTDRATFLLRPVSTQSSAQMGIPPTRGNLLTKVVSSKGIPQQRRGAALSSIWRQAGNPASSSAR